MQLVMLAGELGEKYGTHHEYYNLRTPADAIKLLCVNHPKLQKDLMTAHQNGVGYKLIQSGAAMGYDELHLPFGSRPMMLVPVISGSGGGSTTSILVGVGLVAASFLLPGAGLFGFAGLGGTVAAGTTLAAGSSLVVGSAIGTAIGTGLSAIGASLILGGVANMISPQPEVPKLGSRRMDGTSFRGPGPQGVTRGASGQQSYAYTGPANTVGNGSTIPVVYGRAMLGGHMLSVGIEATDVSDPIATAIKAPGRETILINGSEVEREFNEESGIATKRLDSRDVFQYKTSINNRRRVIPSGDGFGPGLSRSLQENSTQKFGDIDTKVKYEDEFDVLFEIDGGLYGRAGKGENATKIDGFIQYRIEVIHSRSGSNPTVAVAENTIQGYLERSQEYYWAQRLKWTRLENNQELTLRITIMDVDTDAPTKFRVHVFGYDLA
jgi:predicted phage tail protein